MAYTLIPEGFTLKQVSKAEKGAVDEYFGRERRGTYFEGLLSNPNTPLVLAASATPLILAFILNSLKEEGISITEEIWENVVDRAFSWAVPEQEVTGRGPIDILKKKEEAAKLFREYGK